MRRIILSVFVIATGVFLLVGMETVSFSSSTQNRSGEPNPTSSQQTRKYKATKEIMIDQQTGKRRLPTAEETQEVVKTLAVMINNSTEGLRETTLPNGAKMIDLQGRFAPVTLARPNADGTMEVKCVTSFAEAIEFLGLVEDKEQQK